MHQCAGGTAGPRQAVAGYVDLALSVRQRARELGAYELADLIRDGLCHLGVEVRDTTDGVWWDLES